MYLDIEKAFLKNHSVKPTEFMTYVLSKEDTRDKFLKLSDFIAFLLDYLQLLRTKTDLLEESFKELEQIILDLVYQYIICYQDCADYELTMTIAIQYQIHKHIIDQIDRKTFNYIQLCVKACKKETISPFENEMNVVKTPKEIKDLNLNQFIYDNYQQLLEENRMKLIKAILISSLNLQQYFLTQIILKKFIPDLIGPDLIPFIILLKD